MGRVWTKPKPKTRLGFLLQESTAAAAVRLLLPPRCGRRPRVPAARAAAPPAPAPPRRRSGAHGRRGPTRKREREKWVGLSPPFPHRRRRRRLAGLRAACTGPACHRPPLSTSEGEQGGVRETGPSLTAAGPAPAGPWRRLRRRLRLPVPGRLSDHLRERERERGRERERERERER